MPKRNFARLLLALSLAVFLGTSAQAHEAPSNFQFNDLMPGWTIRVKQSFTLPKKSTKLYFQKGFAIPPEKLDPTKRNCKIWFFESPLPKVVPTGNRLSYSSMHLDVAYFPEQQPSYLSIDTAGHQIRNIQCDAIDRPLTVGDLEEITGLFVVDLAKEQLTVSTAQEDSEASIKHVEVRKLEQAKIREAGGKQLPR